MRLEIKLTFDNCFKVAILHHLTEILMFSDSATLS